MSFGFPAYHKQLFSNSNPRVDLEFCAKYAVQTLGWKVKMTHDHGFSAGTSMTIWSWGENILVMMLSPNQMEVKSECILPTQCIDFGQNRRVVEKYLREVQRHINDGVSPMSVPPIVAQTP